MNKIRGRTYGRERMRHEIHDILLYIYIRHVAVTHNVTLYVCSDYSHLSCAAQGYPVPERINETPLVRHIQIRGTSAVRRSLMKSFEGLRRLSYVAADTEGSRTTEESVANSRIGMGFYVRLRSVGRRRGDLAVYTKRQRSEASPEHVERAGSRENSQNRASKRRENGRIRYRRVYIAKGIYLSREIRSTIISDGNGSNSRSGFAPAPFTAHLRSLSLSLLRISSCFRFSPIPLHPLPSSLVSSRAKLSVILSRRGGSYGPIVVPIRVY